METKDSNITPAPSRVKTVTGYVLRYGVPPVITIGLCYLLFAKQDFGEMLRIIQRDCNYNWIVLALVISVFSHIFRAMRWSIQLRALDIKASLFTLTLSIFGTYAVNLVFPRLGEVWRSGYVAQKQDAKFTTVFGSMIAERLADLFTVLFLIIITFIFAGNELLAYLKQNEQMYEKVLAIVSSPWLWSGIAAIITGCVVLFANSKDNKVVKKIKEFVTGLWNGFASIATMPGKGRWLLLTLCIWGCYFMQLYVAFFAFPITSDVVSHYGVTAVLVCFVLSSISMGVPSNGGIGPWQWAIIFGLSMYSAGVPGLTQAYSASFANLVMGSQTLLLIALGLFTFVCIALSRRRSSRSASEK
ncbi:MAG: flippase-like domain-containing protein [Paramuribaculum sp.]|nr:flippase-like domain-containing protein [Paramuribaculum sp.]